VWGYICIGRRPEPPIWPLGGGVKDEKKYFSQIFYEKNIFLFKHLSELYKKTSGVNID
jgi:hypothetical protein